MRALKGGGKGEALSYGEHYGVLSIKGGVLHLLFADNSTKHGFVAKSPLLQCIAIYNSER